LYVRWQEISTIEYGSVSIDYSDLEPLLADSSDTSPCGANLEYDPAFLELERETRGRPAFDLGPYRVEAVQPNWGRAARLAEGLLARSKDLRLAIFLLRARLPTEGIPGLARGLYVLSRLVRDRWSCVHPELEDDDATWRLNALAALSDPVGLLKELEDTVVVRTIVGELTVRELVAMRRAGLHGSRMRESDEILLRAAHRDEQFRAAVTDAARWIDELRGSLVEKLGYHPAAAPLRRLADIIGELRGWSLDGPCAPEEAAEETTARRWVGRADEEDSPIPNDELPRGVEAGTYFKVFRPLAVRPGVWTSFLVYLHSGNAAAVDADSAQRLGSSRLSFGADEEAARVAIDRGADVTVVPAIPGCRFNPRQQRLEWLEDIHTIEFRVQASPDIPGYVEGRLRGYVRVYVGPLLVGEIPTSIVASRDLPFEQPIPIEGAAMQPFSRVFVSYSHDDHRIVGLLQKAYELVHIDYLRDLTLLRAGDRWNARILDEIDRADRFQLCWSL
jgi:hypothetical protein